MQDMNKPIYTKHSWYRDDIDEQATLDNVKLWFKTDYINLVEKADTSYIYAKGFRMDQANSSPKNSGNTTDQRYIEHLNAKLQLEIFNDYLMTFDEKTRKGLESRYIAGKIRKGIKVDYRKLKSALLQIATLKSLLIADDECCKKMNH